MAEQFESEGITDILHLAWAVTPLHDDAKANSVDIDGTMNVIHEAIKATVTHLVHVSSTLAYGAYPDNPIPLIESAPLRGNDDFHYSRNKAIVEDLISKFLKEHPNSISCGIARPSAFLGPGLSNYITGILSGGWRTLFMMPYPDGNTPIQFSHVEDVVNGLMLMVEKRLAGAFNITSGDWVPVGEIPRILGGTGKQLKPGILRALLRFQWALHISQAPPAYLDFVAFPFVASCEKLRAEGFVPRFTTDAALKTLLANK